MKSLIKRRKIINEERKNSKKQFDEYIALQRAKILTYYNGFFVDFMTFPEKTLTTQNLE